MIRLFFLIRSLSHDGAERQLTELVKGLDKNLFAVTVATFYDGGALRSEIEGLEGVKVLSLHKKGRWDVLPFVWRLKQAICEVKPQIVHGYMGIANELCLVAGRTAGAHVVWGLRSSHIDFSRYDRLSAWTYRFGAWLSGFADLIIVNSQAGEQYHIANGYDDEYMVVIHNGIDTKRFSPNQEAGRRMRCQWDIDEHKVVIGLVGRLDPMKDHPTFLRAAALLTQGRIGVHFVCIGDGPELYKHELITLAEELGLKEHLVWAGTSNDMVAVYNALDIVTSASYGEGFSNAIGEAMACGVPCVVTDVGDSAYIVGNSDQVVPAKDPQALMAAWGSLLDLSGEQRGTLSALARERIEQEFNVQRMVEKTASALVSLVR